MDALRSHGRSSCTQTHLIPRRDHSSVLYHPDFSRKIVDFMVAALIPQAPVEPSGRLIAAARAPA
jgi:hypothetical protein